MFSLLSTYVSVESMSVISTRPEFRETHANTVATNKKLSPDFRIITLFKGKERFCAVCTKRSQLEINEDELRHKIEFAQVTWSMSFPHIITSHI